MTRLTISKAASAAGVGVETLRFYERNGLIAAPARTASGYRQYPPQTIRRLQFIVRAKALNFTLREIRELLDLCGTPGASCDDVRARAELKVIALDERIAQLSAVHRALTRLVARCQADAPLGDCPILDALEEQSP